MEFSTFEVKYKYRVLDSISREIISAVRFAKFFAIIKGQNLVLKCKENDDCSEGLVLYVAKPVFKSLENKAELIKIWNWSHNNISWHGFNTNELLFTPDIKHNAANGKFNIFYKDKVYISLIVNRLGTVRVVKELD